MNRLHIGCGRAYLPDWVNVDFFTSVKADVYADVQALPFQAGSFSEVYACHVLEHVQRHSIVATLTHWRSLLASGGVLRVAVPDFQAIVAHYVQATTAIKSALPDIMGLLYGGQNHPKNCHYTTFDFDYLHSCLVAAGFNPASIGLYDWRATSHASVDDYSKAYLPHMDFERGRLMSLNVEAVK